jgi:hypothetical protein
MNSCLEKNINCKNKHKTIYMFFNILMYLILLLTKILSIKKYGIKRILCVLLVLGGISPTAAQRIKSIPFAYLTDASEDRYNQQISQKTISLEGNSFIILSRKSGQEYAVERYGNDLKRIWAATIPLAQNERLEAFAHHLGVAYVLTLTTDQRAGLQTLRAHIVDVGTGANKASQKLMEAPASSRQIGSSISQDGSKVVAYEFQTTQHSIRTIRASIFDASFSKLKDRTYDFRNLPNTLSAEVLIDNKGDQYVTVISDNLTKMTVRRYSNTESDVKVMEVKVGGVFDGRRVYVVNNKFQLEQDQALYGAAFCADEETGEYHSLKAVRFDFVANDMRLAPEFRFTPQYLTDMAKANKTDLPNPIRLEDIYLSDIVVTADKNVVIIAEKKYVEGGENSPYLAQDLHLFAFNEYLSPTWRSVLMKNQKAPADEAFTGISFRSKHKDNMLYLLTLETLNKKSDLYLRKINVLNGQAEAPKGIGLNIANDQQVSYVKDFTAWLDEKTVVAVNRPSKKSASLRLSRISIR